MTDLKLVRKYLPNGYAIYEYWLVPVLGGVNEALIMSNLLYWNGKGAKPGWIYKTIETMHIETGLSYSQQRTAIERLKENKVIEVKAMGVPAKRYFKVHIDQLINLISRNEILAELTPENQLINKSINERSITRNKNKEINKQVRKLYRLYLSVSGLPPERSRLTKARVLLLIDRLEDAGYEMCVHAVRNCAKNEFYNGTQDGDFKISFELVFKTYERVEELANLSIRNE